MTKTQLPCQTPELVQLIYSKPVHKLGRGGAHLGVGEGSLTQILEYRESSGVGAMKRWCVDGQMWLCSMSTLGITNVRPINMLLPHGIGRTSLLEYSN